MLIGKLRQCFGVLVDGAVSFEFRTRLRNPVLQRGKASAEIQWGEFVDH
jgi:hypothetical protein